MKKREESLRLVRVAFVAGLCVVSPAVLYASGRRPATRPTRRPKTHDLLILRSGKRVEGEVPECDADACRIGGKSYTRDEIAWIALEPPATTPPHVRGIAEDEVHLRDESVHTGHLVGVSLGEVDIEGGTWDRPEVAWIHLAGAVESPPPSGSGAIAGQEATPPTRGGGGADNAPQGGDGGGKNGGGQSADHAGEGASGDHPPPPPPSHAGGKAGGLWSGEIHVHFRVTNDKGSTDIKSDLSPHLRERRYPLLRPSDGKTYGSVVHLDSEGTEIRTKEVIDSGDASYGSHCDGSGTYSGPLDSSGSTIWIASLDADTTPWIGFPIERGHPSYSIAFAAPAARYTVDCLGWRINGGVREEFPSTNEEAYYLVGFGRNPLGCPEFLRTVCDPQIRRIEGERGRMFGSFHNTWEENGFHNDLEVRWSLCRDDVPCAIVPPEPQKKPCGGSAAEEGNLQVCEDAARALLAPMKVKWDAYQRGQAKASLHQADFMKAIGACVGWDAAELAIEALVATEVPSIGLSAEQAAEVEEFAKSLELINNLMKAATTGDPLEAFKSGDYGDFIGALEQVKKFFETVPLLDHGEPEQFLEHLENCDAPLSEDLKSSAVSFLTETQRSMEDLNAYRELGNDLVSKQNECLQLQWKAYAACVQDARCKGTPESACDALKPPGNWPEVP